MTAGVVRPAPTVRVGIDAGGTRTRARAALAGIIVHDGTGGPGNPLTTEATTLQRSFRAALAGCPPASHVIACVAGTSGPAQHGQLATMLARLVPDAIIRVLPDYVAALYAAPAGTDVCVIAGTGSVICSKASDGGYPVSGGLGWMLGDHGSAVRLGRAALEYFVTDPASASPSFAAGIEAVFGARDDRMVARAINTAPHPPQLLARAAPLLTAAADDRAEWALSLLGDEMTGLARTAAGHIARYAADRVPVRIALSGGVWASPAAEAAFTAALAQLSPRRAEVVRSASDPVDGAVRLAETMTG